MQVGAPGLVNCPRSHGTNTNAKIKVGDEMEQKEKKVNRGILKRGSDSMKWNPLHTHTHTHTLTHTHTADKACNGNRKSSLLFTVNRSCGNLLLFTWPLWCTCVHVTHCFKIENKVITSSDDRVTVWWWWLDGLRVFNYAVMLMKVVLISALLATIVSCVFCLKSLRGGRFTRLRVKLQSRPKQVEHPACWHFMHKQNLGGTLFLTKRKNRHSSSSSTFLLQNTIHLQGRRNIWKRKHPFFSTLKICWEQREVKLGFQALAD